MIADIGMIADAAVVRLRPEGRAVLEARLRAPTTEQRQVFVSRPDRAAGGRRASRSIARELGTMPRTVNGWRGRFARACRSGDLSREPTVGSFVRPSRFGRLQGGLHRPHTLKHLFADGRLRQQDHGSRPRLIGSFARIKFRLKNIAGKNCPCSFIRMTAEFRLSANLDPDLCSINRPLIMRVS